MEQSVIDRPSSPAVPKPITGMEFWKTVVKKWPPGPRREWLASSRGEAALGRKQARGLVKQLDDAAAKIARDACSAPWIESWVEDGVGPPARDRTREHAVNLILSRRESRICGVGGLQSLETPDSGYSQIASRRWTPPQCVSEEDSADEMRKGEPWPSSPSAVALQTIRAIGRRSCAKGKRAPGRYLVWQLPAESPEYDRIEALEPAPNVLIATERDFSPVIRVSVRREPISSLTVDLGAESYSYPPIP